MPQLGFYHDDSIYWVSAKALASGSGYRIDSLPRQPWQTKYPPLFPALLALVWKLNPDFPANVPLATLAVWLAFPVYVLLVRALLKQLGLGAIECWALTMAASWNPMGALLSISLMPEILFMTAFLGCILLAERALDPQTSGWLAVNAGLLGAFAYLTKSAALPLLVTVPFCFALRRRYMRALAFAAAMLPAVVAWEVWVVMRVSKSSDLVSLYYTNYTGFRAYNLSWADLPRVMWLNLDGLLRSAGKLLMFDVPVFEAAIFERLIAVTAIAGVIRLALRSRRLQYPFVALGMTGLLLVWHYQPEQRLIFPLYPLLLAGLWIELRNFAAALRRSWDKRAVADRIAAGIGAMALASLALFIAYTHLAGDLVFLPNLLALYRSDLEATRPAYAWIAQHAPAEAGVYAYDDPLIYLYTQRRACSLPVPPKLYYRDLDRVVPRFLQTLPSFSREQGLDYMLLTKRDFYRDLHDEGAKLSRRAIARSSEFKLEFTSGDTEIYRRLTP